MEPKKKKQKIVSYSPSHHYKINGKIHTMASAVYKVGIYVIYDDNPKLQGTTTPENIRTLQNKLKKEETAGKISDLYLSPAIRVTLDANGFYIQLKDGDTAPENKEGK